MTTMFTTVLNLRTGQELVYALPPEQAVVNAFYQYGPRKDYSTHEYDYSLVQRVRGTVVCGDFAARLSDQVLVP